MSCCYVVCTHPGCVCETVGVDGVLRCECVLLFCSMYTHSVCETVGVDGVLRCECVLLLCSMYTHRVCV